MPLGSDHFLLRDRHCVKEGLHRRFSEAAASLMWPCLIVPADPQIDVGLQLVERTIHLFSERDAVELVEHGLVEALADTVGLSWATRESKKAPRRVAGHRGWIRQSHPLRRRPALPRAARPRHP